MTAAERLVALAGTTGTAAALLLLIGSGSTAGAALVNYSGVTSDTAAVHLMTDVASDATPSVGAGHPKGIYWGETKIKRGKRLDDVLKKAMERMVEEEIELEPETSAAKAIEIVRPFVEESSIDWNAVENDLKKVKELLNLWQEQMQALEEEEMLLLMMS